MSRAPFNLARPGRGGGPSSGGLVGADMVNGPLSPIGGRPQETAERGTAGHGGIDTPDDDGPRPAVGPRRTAGDPGHFGADARPCDIRTVDGGPGFPRRPARRRSAGGASGPPLPPWV